MAASLIEQRVQRFWVHAERGGQVTDTLERPGCCAQLDAIAQLTDARDAAGPAGWLPWATGLRNVYVHRARRMSKGLTSPTVALVGPNGQPIPRTESIHLLPREPSLSEIEILSGGDPLSVLSEPAETTLVGVVGSARTLANDAAQILTHLWLKRRQQSGLIEQPAEQWEEVATPADAFRGYDAGSVKANPDTLVAAPDMQDRLRVASLDGDNKGRWQTFD